MESRPSAHYVKHGRRREGPQALRAFLGLRLRSLFEGVYHVV